MKWFQPLECDNTVENPLVCDYDNLEDIGFNENDFKMGKRIERWDNNVFFQAKEKEDDGEPDDALQSSSMLPIYSERLVNELKKEKINGIQYLPARILRPNNMEIKGFSLVNILNFIKAFNYEKSNYNRFRDDFPNPKVQGKLAGVTKYVLHKDKLLGMDIIRLADYKQSFFVSEKIKMIFERNNFTGYSFKEIELT